MKTFKEYLNESKETVYKNYTFDELDSMFKDLIDFSKGNKSSYYIDEIENGTFDKKILTDYKKVFNVLKDVAKTNDQKTFLWIPQHFNFYYKTENLEKKFNSEIDFLNSVYKVYNIIKIGDTSEKFQSKLSKIAEQMRYENMSIEDIHDEIQKFDGVVKLRGPWDIYIKFSKNKIISKNL